MCLAFLVRDGGLKCVMVQTGMTVDPALVRDDQPSKDQLSEMSEVDLAAVLKSASLLVVPQANKMQIVDATHKDGQAVLAKARGRSAVSRVLGPGRPAESDGLHVAVQGQKEWGIKEQAYMKCDATWRNMLLYTGFDLDTSHPDLMDVNQMKRREGLLSHL